MRRPFFAALLVTIATGISATPRPADHARSTPPKLGQQAPPFTLRDHLGKRVSLAEAAGKRVVLVFYRGYW